MESAVTDATLKQEASELAAAGPGRVEVGNTASTEFVQGLREARLRLSDSEIKRVATMTGEARAVLDLVEPGVKPEMPGLKQRFIRALTLGGMASKEAVDYSRDTVALNAAGGPTPRPVGISVRTALEAAAIARVLDLPTALTSLLEGPWQQRSIAV